MLKFTLLTIFMSPSGDLTTTVEYAPTALACQAQLRTNVEALKKYPRFVLRHIECYPPSSAD